MFCEPLENISLISDSNDRRKVLVPPSLVGGSTRADSEPGVSFSGSFSFEQINHRTSTTTMICSKTTFILRGCSTGAHLQYISNRFIARAEDDKNVRLPSSRNGGSDGKDEPSPLQIYTSDEIRTNLNFLRGALSQ